MGRFIRLNNIGKAFEVATDTTRSINKLAGIDAVPVVSKLPGGYLIGFLDRTTEPRPIGATEVGGE